MLTSSEKKRLLDLARQSINCYLKTNHYLKYQPLLKTDKAFLDRHGCFVTLTINGNLRGCIGYLEPQGNLAEDIIHNAVSAAFFDPRFPPIKANEINQLTIEISLLSKPITLNYRSVTNLLDTLQKEKPGVIIRHGVNQATFLPQVWADLPRASDFLSELCLKADLTSNFWLKNKLTVSTYQVIHFSDQKK